MPQEGVYVGYRYTETRYYEKVMSADKSDAFDYGAVVSHPFGSGLVRVLSRGDQILAFGDDICF